MRPSAAPESDHGDGAPARDRGASRPSGALTQVSSTAPSPRIPPRAPRSARAPLTLRATPAAALERFPPDPEDVTCSISARWSVRRQRWARCYSRARRWSQPTTTRDVPLGGLRCACTLTTAQASAPATDLPITSKLVLDLRNAPWALTTRGSLTLSCFYRLSPTGGGEAGVPNPLSYTPSPFRESG